MGSVEKLLFCIYKFVLNILKNSWQFKTLLTCNHVFCAQGLFSNKMPPLIERGIREDNMKFMQECLRIHQNYGLLHTYPIFIWILENQVLSKQIELHAFWLNHKKDKN